jgi:hypothetical protein
MTASHSGSSNWDEFELSMWATVGDMNRESHVILTPVRAYRALTVTA